MRNQVMSTPNVTLGVIKRMGQVLAIVALQAALLMISAGTLEWTAAWLYIGVYLALIAVNALVVLPRNPELIAERGAPKENTKGWDKVVANLNGLATMAALVVAGLDFRWGGSPRGVGTVELTALAGVALGYALFSWAMASNPFFSTVVRIQGDRGHTVAAAGPYRYVRHPGYVGWIVMSIATPLLLGSLWALVPGVLSAVLMVVRTALEDRTLQAELAGYREYAGRVRYRLVPGVW